MEIALARDKTFVALKIAWILKWVLSIKRWCFLFLTVHI